MSATLGARRIAMDQLAPRPFAEMLRLEKAIDLDERVRHLVTVRASQVNGCAFCIDMHWKEARAAGESEDRLYSLDAWRESPLYSARERAALALCEAVTLIADSQVPDEAWDAAAAEIEPGALSHLVFAITAINGWNRLVISARLEPGSYRR